MRSVMITGGCGFIGSHLVKLINRIEPDTLIYIVDCLTYAGNIKNLNLKSDHVIFYRNDINEITPIFIEERNIKTVFNLAAESHVDRSIKDPKAFLETDIMGLFNLVMACRKAGVEKFIQASTDEVYGPIAYPLAATEDIPLNPTSPYSASKASADLLLLAYYKTYNFPVIIARMCNNFGSHQYPEKLIPMAILKLLNREKIPVHGAGFNKREWISVERACESLLFLEQCGSIGEIYNIGSGQILSNLGVVSNIIHIMFEEDVLPEDKIEFVSDRPGNDSRYALNSNKFRDLCYRRSLMFEALDVGKSNDHFQSILTNTIMWYRKNLNHWEDIDLSANAHREGEYLR